MTIALLLAGYPRSVLASELHVAILAYLERTGGATVKDLEEGIPSSPQQIMAATLDLHRNQLVEVLSEHIRVTDRTKPLLERFGVHQDIIDDVLDDFVIHPKERESCARILLHYRHDAFAAYQGSLCTLQTWKDVLTDLSSRDNALRLAVQPKSDLGTLASMTLLLRDLKDWRKSASGYSPRHATSRGQYDIDFILNTEPPIAAEAKMKNTNIFIALKWLKALEGPEDTSSEFLVGSGAYRSTFRILKQFNTIQRTVPADCWLDFYKKATKEIAGRGSTDVDILSAIAGVGRRYAEALVFKQPPAGVLSSRTPDELPKPGDFMSALLAARNIEEFASLLSRPEEAARSALQTLVAKCQLLLHDKENVSQGGPPGSAV